MKIAYVYEGQRALPEKIEISAGPCKTAPLELLGAREGNGKASFPNGDTYTGAYINGVRGGLGSYSYARPPGGDDEGTPRTSNFVGCWKAGKKSGVGTMVYADGAKYHGTWRNGKREGQGTFFYANGDIFTGEWAAGAKAGHGTYIYKESGAQISGTWANGMCIKGSFADKYQNAFSGSFLANEGGGVVFGEGGVFKFCNKAEYRANASA